MGNKNSNENQNENENNPQNQVQNNSQAQNERNDDENESQNLPNVDSQNNPNFRLSQKQRGEKLLPHDFESKRAKEEADDLNKAFAELKKLQVNFNHREPNRDGNLGYEDEYNKNKSINYGKPLKINNQVWLTYDCPITTDVNSPLVDIPVGYRIPSIKDYLILFKNLGPENIEKLCEEGFLNMKKELFYITTTKYNKKLRHGGIIDSWRFKSIGFNRIVEKEPEWSKKKYNLEQAKNIEFLKQLDRRLDTGNI